MSAQDCIVCDQCGKHEPRPLAWGGLRTTDTADAISILPAGWWTFAPEAKGIEWKTFCGVACVLDWMEKHA